VFSFFNYRVAQEEDDERKIQSVSELPTKESLTKVNKYIKVQRFKMNNKIYAKQIDDYTFYTATVSSLH